MPSHNVRNHLGGWVVVLCASGLPTWQSLFERGQDFQAGLIRFESIPKVAVRAEFVGPPIETYLVNIM